MLQFIAVKTVAQIVKVALALHHVPHALQTTTMQEVYA